MYRVVEWAGAERRHIQRESQLTDALRVVRTRLEAVGTSHASLALHCLPRTEDAIEESLNTFSHSEVELSIDVHEALSNLSEKVAEAIRRYNVSIDVLIERSFFSTLKGEPGCCLAPSSSLAEKIELLGQCGFRAMISNLHAVFFPDIEPAEFMERLEQFHALSIDIVFPSEEDEDDFCSASNRVARLIAAFEHWKQRRSDQRVALFENLIQFICSQRDLSLDWLPRREACGETGLVDCFRIGSLGALRFPEFHIYREEAFRNPTGTQRITGWAHIMRHIRQVLIQEIDAIEPKDQRKPASRSLDNGFATLPGMHESHEPIVQLAKRALGAGRNASVLDLGCGNGALLHRIVRNTAAIPFGIELDCRKVVVARRLLSRHRGRVEQGNLFSNDAIWTEKFFDLVLVPITAFLEAPPSLTAVLKTKLVGHAKTMIVYAYDDDRKRFGTLSAMANRAGISLLGKTLNGVASVAALSPVKARD